MRREKFNGETFTNSSSLYRHDRVNGRRPQRRRPLHIDPSCRVLSLQSPLSLWTMQQQKQEYILNLFGEITHSVSPLLYLGDTTMILQKLSLAFRFTTNNLTNKMCFHIKLYQVIRVHSLEYTLQIQYLDY